MKYRTFVMLLVIVFLISLCFTAETLNRQLRIQAATVFDCGLSGDDIRVSVLNCEGSIEIPWLAHSLKTFGDRVSSPEIKSSPLFIAAADRLHRGAVSLKADFLYYYEVLREFFANHIHGEG